jgi:hypothetical protein
VILFVVAASEDEAERLAAERLQAALDATNLSTSFRLPRLDVTKQPG